MNIQVENCNNIDFVDVQIIEHKLNIKLAPNGSGKSTISNAIHITVSAPETINDKLMPFKYREQNPIGINPKVKGLENIKSVMCFNEEYVRQFSFQQDELMSNSFDILIRNDEYKAIELEIETLISETRKVFIGNEELEILLSALRELGGAFKLSNSGVSLASTGMKGLKNGNKIQHIPVGLESYKPFIQSDKTVSWVAWQSQGCDFNNLSENCPYCTSDTSEKRTLIDMVSKEYDKNTIKNLVGIIQIIEKLGDYLSEDAKNKLSTITTIKEGLESEHITFIVNIKKQIDNFVDKLEKLKSLSNIQFESSDKIEEKLKGYELNLDFFTSLDSEKMRQAIEPIKISLQVLIEKAGILKGKINMQQNKMKSLIEKHQKNINDFLSYAGYKYIVEIPGTNENSKLRLKHIDYNEHLLGGNQHLSFGERNAFSIVLFMYECLSKKPDLIILDDPISSFDKNKKYAILEMLFRRDAINCLKNKTVIMLTHDVEPIIDTIKSLSMKFGNLTTASFLKMKSGIITEIQIAKTDIKMFTEICKEINASTHDEITKLVYLRRQFEIINGDSDGYQVLSNLLHKRNTPVDYRETKNTDETYPDMQTTKFHNGCLEIKNYMNSFDYIRILKRIKNKDEIKRVYYQSNNGYEKLQLFRLLEVEISNSVIQKFVNETYHVENEFVCQLNPTKFDTIPEYVITECDNVLALI